MLTNDFHLAHPRFPQSPQSEEIAQFVLQVQVHKLSDSINNDHRDLNFVNSQFEDAPNEISNETNSREQRNDKETNDLINQNFNSPIQSNFFISPSSGLLCQTVVNNQNNNHLTNCQIVLPMQIRAKALCLSHLTHFGVQKTFETLSARFHWKGSYIDTVNFIVSCQDCLLAKKQRVPQTLLQAPELPRSPGELISLDFVEPFKNGKSILTIIDHFSRYLHVKEMSKTIAEKVSDVLFEYITSFGKP